jgi:hypothetical protein
MYKVATPKEETDTPALDDSRLDEILLEQELDDATKDFPDFSAAGTRIDEIIPHYALDKYNADAVVKVAARRGFDVDVCTCRLAHDQPIARANGKWVGVSKGMDYEKYDRVLCPYCKEKKAEDGRVVQPIFKAVSQFI